MKSRQFNDSDCFYIDTPFEQVWKELTAHRHNEGKGCRVRIKATPSAVTIINGSYSDYPCKVITCSDTAESDGRFRMDLQFDYLPSARTFLLGFWWIGGCS